jgi:hypothetical protein
VVIFLTLTVAAQGPDRVVVLGVIVDRAELPSAD